MITMEMMMMKHISNKLSKEVSKNLSIEIGKKKM